jgi:hypothetical protein
VRRDPADVVTRAEPGIRATGVGGSTPETRVGPAVRRERAEPDARSPGRDLSVSRNAAGGAVVGGVTGSDAALAEEAVVGGAPFGFAIVVRTEATASSRNARRCEDLPHTRRSSASGLTGVIGLPPVTTATQFSTAVRAIAQRVSFVALPMCGVRTTFGRSTRPGSIAGSRS